MAKETTIGEKSVKTRWRKRRVLHTNMYQSVRQSIGSLSPSSFNYLVNSLEDDSIGGLDSLLEKKVIYGG